MEYIYTALLLHSAGKEINETNVKKVVEGAGIKVDDAKVKALIAALEGVNIDEIIKQAAMPVAVAAAPAVGHKVEAKKEEKVEEKTMEAEEAAAGLASLFG